MTTDLFPEVKPHLGIDDDNQRFTTRETLRWCMAKAGVDGFDFDVAACAESHMAPNYFTREQDGLTQEWVGRVWCNPPFADIEPWVAKAWASMSDSLVIAMLLPASRTEQKWWQELVEARRDRDCLDCGPWNTSSGGFPVRFATHFLPGRTRFGHPGNPEGIGVGSPPFGCVLLVWRRT